MAGLMVTSIGSGRIITPTGRYKIFPIVGTVLMLDRPLPAVDDGRRDQPAGSPRVYMLVLGLGIGMIIQVMVLAVQNAVEHRDLGTATGAETFSRSMGGAFGVAIFGAILTNRLAHNLSRLLPKGVDLHGIDPNSLTASPAAIRALPAPTRAAVIEALARSIHVVFLFAVPLAVLAFGVTWLLKESPLRETAHIGLEDVVGEPVVPEE